AVVAPPPGGSPCSRSRGRGGRQRCGGCGNSFACWGEANVGSHIITAHAAAGPSTLCENLRWTRTRSCDLMRFVGPGQGDSVIRRTARGRRYGLGAAALMVAAALVRVLTVPLSPTVRAVEVV